MPWRLKPSLRELVARELRRRKMSTAALARLTGVDRRRLGRWLKGERDMASDDVGIVLARLGFKVKPPGR